MALGRVLRPWCGSPRKLVSSRRQEVDDQIDVFAVFLVATSGAGACRLATRLGLKGNDVGLLRTLLLDTEAAEVNVALGVCLVDHVGLTLADDRLDLSDVGVVCHDDSRVP